MGKISKETSRLFNRALLSFITGFVFSSIYIEQQTSWAPLVVAVPAFVSGIYYIYTAYNRSKKEL